MVRGVYPEVFAGYSILCECLVCFKSGVLERFGGCS